MQHSIKFFYLPTIPETDEISSLTQYKLEYCDNSHTNILALFYRSQIGFASDLHTYLYMLWGELDYNLFCYSVGND